MNSNQNKNSIINTSTNLEYYIIYSIIIFIIVLIVTVLILQLIFTRSIVYPNHMLSFIYFSAAIIFFTIFFYLTTKYLIPFLNY